MPSKIRVVYENAGKIWFGKRAWRTMVDYALERAPGMVRKIQEWEELSVWKRCQKLHASKVLKGNLLIWRERAHLREQESNYQLRLRQYGVLRVHKPRMEDPVAQVRRQERARRNVAQLYREDRARALRDLQRVQARRDANILGELHVEELEPEEEPKIKKVRIGIFR